MVSKEMDKTGFLTGMSEKGEKHVKTQANQRYPPYRSRLIIPKRKDNSK
jgi:hypothetical protein